MSLDVSQLEDQIRGILQAPGVDLATISAKRVRKRLLELDSSLTVDIVKENKDEIDGLISTVFEQVSAESQGYGDGEEGGDSDSGEQSKRKRSGHDDDDVMEPSTPPKKKRKAKKQELSDAELARQLSTELNSRSRSSRAVAGPSKGKANGTRKKKNAKSAATVDSDAEDGESKPKRKGGFTKEYELSAPLATLLKAERMSRPQVVKHIWDYIKANNLQNPEDRREIIFDDNLKAVFNVDRLGMFKMNKELGQHLIAPEP